MTVSMDSAWCCRESDKFSIHLYESKTSPFKQSSFFIFNTSFDSRICLKNGDGDGDGGGDDDKVINMGMEVSDGTEMK